MKYYVVADVHGFYKELVAALKEKGYYEDNTPHKLIICGDLFDRGREAKELQQFVLDLMEKDEVILIRGNHEDLMLDLINHPWEYCESLATLTYSHHYRNRTVDTLQQLTGATFNKLIYDTQTVMRYARRTPFIDKIIPAMLDYFETDNYIFVHGWIPCSKDEGGFLNYDENWRSATKESWDEARWLNGMQCACAYNIIEPNKTIVCGHWHTSYGHHWYGDAKREFGEGEDFSPFYAKGIIALDGCTARSGKVNCIVIED
jgi:serine/threonine protein phosphatase 1